MPQPPFNAWTPNGILPLDEFSLALSDLGVLQAVVAVDRLRTFNGKLPEELLGRHVERFRRSCAGLHISLPSTDLEAAVADCLEANGAWNQPRLKDTPEDVSLVLMATPGAKSGTTTLVIYPTKIDWERLAHWYTHGQAIELSQTRNVSASSWSPQIKTRARLQYYLADHACTQKFANAILLDEDGNLTETSVANAIVLEGSRLLCPCKEKILQGISLGKTLELAADLGLELEHKDITPARAQAADGMLLCGSTGCLWGACRFMDRTWESPTSQDVLMSLTTAWEQYLGLDYQSQAIQLQSDARAEGRL